MKPRKETPAERKARSRRILDRLEKEFPGARCDLAHRNPFELLVATILSAQCTDERVNRVSPALFGRYPDAAALARAVPRELEEAIRPTGFYRNKARSLLGCAKALVERHGGEVPPRLEDLVALPGVGRKTANVLLGAGFGQEALVVETHVIRIAARLGLTREKDPERIERDLAEVVPRSRWTRLAHLLIYFGRAICKAPRPLCLRCPVARFCPYPEKTTA